MPAGNRLRILSLSWGVDSWTVAAMAALGAIPPIDYAIHIDTGYERAASIDFARRWHPWLAAHNLTVVTIIPPDNRIITHSSHITIPAHSLSPSGARSLLPRHCNRSWKTYPSRRFFRSRMRHHSLKLLPGTIHHILGISADESSRVRTSPVHYVKNCYPLVDLNLTRADAIAWLRSKHLPVPSRSACYMCPLTPLADWALRRSTPDWHKAVIIDRAIRHAHRHRGYTTFLHRSLQPLDSIDFHTYGEDP